MAVTHNPWTVWEVLRPGCLGLFGLFFIFGIFLSWQIRIDAGSVVLDIEGVF